MLTNVGSSLERWHNILRTGLDYSETICGRVSERSLRTCKQLMYRRKFDDRSLLTGTRRLTDRYGHGVYFSPESSVSICSYSQPSRWTRAEADFPVERATALVELGKWLGIHMEQHKLDDAVNVPETFVSRKPYYVGT